MTGQSIAVRMAGLRMLRRSLAAASPSQIRQFLRKSVFGRIRSRLSRLRRQVIDVAVQAVDRRSGPEKGNVAFWRYIPSLRGWSDVENRLAFLWDNHPQAIDSFVALALQTNKDPIVLIELARNLISRDIFARHLQAVNPTDDSALSTILRQRQQYAATFISVVQLLLDDESAGPVVAQTLRLHRAITGPFVQIIYSAGTRTALPQLGQYTRGATDSGFRKPVLRRLIIVYDYKDVAAVAQLFHGARHVTILALTDLLGRADFSAYVGRGGVERIEVEHLRTRVSRFSEAYVRNHEEARDAGQLIAQMLADQPGLLSPDLQTFMAVSLCDFLHFQCLKTAAVRALLADTAFDHIAIGTAEHGPTSEFIRLLSGIPEIATDARVELVSISRRMVHRTQFLDCLDVLTGRTPIALTRKSLPLELAHATDQIKEHADRIAGRLANNLGDGDGADQPDVLLFTTNNPAYNMSTAAYALAIDQSYPTHVIHFGLRASELRTEMLKLGDRASAITVRIVPAPLKDRWDSTQRTLIDYLWQAQSRLVASDAAHIVKINAARLVSEVISPQLVTMTAMDMWFARMQAANALPKLVVLAPARLAQIAAMSSIARRYGVATLIIEAHGLNANYSRYLKVTSDFYGVVSDYFRKDAAHGFAMPLDRTRVIGSPRILAPADHDPAQAQNTARDMLTTDQNIPFEQRSGTISFFCQPSAWDHVEKVWRSVLAAARALDVDVLLKTHPEETPTRQALYLRIADEMQMQGQVHVVTGAPDAVIDASDVVLTGYSAAALDAAVRQVPVICVTEGDVDYPVDQHAMIDAPLVRSTQELQGRLRTILSDLGAARMQAKQFLLRESQFVEGSDDRLKSFVADILAMPSEDRLRRSETLPDSVFLDSPHPIFPV